MRSAPAVTVRCSGGWPWRLVQALLPALAAGSVTAWSLMLADWPAFATFFAIAAAACAGLFAWWRAAPQAVDLRWDGQTWFVAAARGRLQLMVSPGPAMLLRLWPEGGGAPCWVAVTATEAAGAWHALRAAVYSRASEATPRVPHPDRAAD